MTQKEFFKTVALETSNSEIKDYCAKAIDTIEKRNTARATADSRKRAEVNEPLLKALKELFTANPLTVYVASDLGAKLGISTSKASALCRKLQDDNIIKSDMVKSKSGKVKGYTLKRES